VFARVARIDVGMPYPVFAYCGLVAWNLFASSLRFSIVPITSNIALVTKVYFPRELFPVSAILVSLVDFAIANVVLIPLMAYYQIPPSPMVISLPVVLLVHLTFTTGVALLIAMANLFYHDVNYLFEVVLTILMFATSVLYPISLIGGRTGQVMRLSPMSPVIAGYRAVMITGDNPFTVAANTTTRPGTCRSRCRVVWSRVEPRVASPTSSGGCRTCPSACGPVKRLESSVATEPASRRY
jgi:lipopolysaccharide transport system permease protein